jgi:tetratricopeptide (TPR) repeat protein
VKNLFYTLFLLLAIPVLCFAQDITALQKEAEQLELTSDEAAFKKYQEILHIQPVNLLAICKSSELCSAIGHKQTAKSLRIDYFKTARRYAEIALKLSPTSSEANFVMAIAMGRMALMLGGREKIEAVNDIKKYSELSIKYNPSNFKPYHVLGRWHYEVSNLGGLERAAARLFYGGLPPASLKEAIYNYEKSMSLSPDALVNYTELAKCYMRNNQKQKAIALLQKLMLMTDKTPADVRVKEEGKKLMKERN